MNSYEISTILKSDELTKTLFKGVYAADQIPTVTTYPSAFVVNTDPRYRGGQHWVSIYFDGVKKGEFFDSYGNKPMHYSQYFVDCLQENSISYISNKVGLQSYSSNVCGFYCILYIYCKSRQMKMSEIVQMFTSDKLYNDWTVTNFVNRNFKTNFSQIKYFSF